MKLSRAIGPDDHIRGLGEAPVTLVEYADYQSPACGEAYYMIRALQAEMRERLQSVFRNFPLASIHPFAEYAAFAAEAAGAQGQFWTMHDFLFENPVDVERGRLLTYARSIGLDASRIEHEIAERRYAARIQADIHSGIRSGVNGTPTFFINDIRFEGNWNFELLLAALKAALKARNAPFHSMMDAREKL